MVGREPDTNAINKKAMLSELARLFLNLGVIGFGGPAVHIALIKEEGILAMNARAGRDWCWRVALLLCHQWLLLHYLPGPISAMVSCLRCDPSFMASSLPPGVVYRSTFWSGAGSSYPDVFKSTRGDLFVLTSMLL